jgi:murein DD-endopeptidase MepM/ murein hydrolase activator NlpD
VKIVYRLCNATSRALLILAGALALGVLMGSPAHAEEPPTPRAIPVVRTYPRAFSSYDALIAYAATIAADQNALDLRAGAVRVERNALSATLSTDVASISRRGGRLFEPDTRRDARAASAATSARVSALLSLDSQLVQAGALTTPQGDWRMPTIGRITQPFGPTRLALEPARVYAGVSYAHFHDGLDLAGEWSADVVAPARARVVFVGLMGAGAEVVVLAHDGGVVTLYAHLNASTSPPPVTAGDEVAAGQKIGTVGNTGISTGMHLHWSAWREGALIDPVTLLGH